jgi:hypothetical protein
MNFIHFFKRLLNISDSYHWDVNDDNRLTAVIQSGPFKGFRLNPITALAHKSGFGFFNDNKRDTIVAGRLLGFKRSFVENVYKATTSHDNHGDVQVLRGRIRSVLEV